MAINHGQSLHCSVMGNSLSSLGEALKRMNSTKYVRNAQMMQLSYKCIQKYGNKGINWHFW